MVDFMYKGSYDFPEDDSALSVHVELYAIADKYIISELQGLAVKSYCKFLENAPSFDIFLDSLSSVYDTTPAYARGLRDAAIDFSRKELVMFVNDSPEMKADFDRVRAEIPDFANDLLDSFVQDQNLGHCTQCEGSYLVPIRWVKTKFSCGMESECKQCGHVIYETEARKPSRSRKRKRDE